MNVPQLAYQHRWLALLILTALVLTSSYQASAESYLSEEDLLGDIPMISSASHFPQKRSDAPVSVTIIDQQLIRASGALNVPDLFRLVPGFQSYMVNYGRPTANYHALPEEYPHRMEVKIDGRSIYEPLISAVLWESMGLQLEDIDYIEVVRGANAAADGSNSFNGSINIITKTPQATQGTTVRTVVGDNQTRNISLVNSGNSADFSYRLTGEYKINDGFPPSDLVSMEDDNEIAYLGFYGSWTPTLYDTVDIQVGVNDSEIAIDSKLSDVTGTLYIPWSFLTHYQYINWRHRVDDRNHLQLLFYHNHMTINAGEDVGTFSELFGVDPGLLVPGLQDFTVRYELDDASSDRYDLELRHHLQFAEGSQLSWGAAIRYDYIDYPAFFNQQPAFGVQSERMFGNLQYSLSEKWLLNIGAIAEHHEDYGNNESFRYSLNFKPSQDHSFRLSYNDASRAPTVLEQRDYFAVYEQGFLIDVSTYADPNIGEEKLESTELAYLGSFLQQTLNVDIKLFDERNIGLITGRSDDLFPGDLDNKVTVRDNVTDVDYRGIETQISYQPNHHWLISGQYQYVRIDTTKVDSVDPLRIIEDKKTSPAHIGSLLINYNFDNGIESSIIFYHQSDVDWSGGDYVDAYERIDIRLGKMFRLTADTSLDINLIAQNAFGSDYNEYSEFNRFETRYFVKANLAF